MDKASEALADVRGWLCDNLSEGDAGRACGMLSAVSRHIVALESENENLLKTVDSVMPKLIEDNAKLKVENAKLWDMLARYIRQAYVQACDKGNPITVRIIEDDARELGIEVPHD